MATAATLLSKAEQDGTAARAQLPRTAQCDVLSGAHVLPMAQPAQRLCAVGHGLSLFTGVEEKRVVGNDSPAPAPASASGRGSKIPTQCGDCGQPERQEQ